MPKSASAVVTPIASAGYHGATMTDAALVRAVLEGQSAAFTTLVDRHARVCLRYATRMLGNLEDAEDVTQETFVRAYRALGRFDETAEFRTWVMSILINRCRSALRMRVRRAAVVATDDAGFASAAIRPAAEDAVLRDAIDRAVAQLEAGQREAFLLKHVEQMSYEEMHAATGVGISALKMRVQRACERLQQLLEEDRNA